VNIHNLLIFWGERELYFQTILPVTVQETNCYMQEDARTREKPEAPDSPETSMKDLHIFLATIVWMGHDHKHSIKQYWEKKCYFLFQCDDM
jgi:hypothetical protein